MTINQDFLVTLKVDEDFDPDDVETVLKLLQELVDEGLGPVHGVSRVYVPSSDERLRVHAERAASMARSRAMRAEREQVDRATELVGDEVISDRDWYRRFERWMRRNASNYAEGYVDLESATSAMAHDLADFMAEAMEQWAEDGDFGSGFARQAVMSMIHNVSWEDLADHYREEMTEMIEDAWRGGR